MRVDKERKGRGMNWRGSEIQGIRELIRKGKVWERVRMGVCVKFGRLIMKAKDRKRNTENAQDQVR